MALMQFVAICYFKKRMVSLPASLTIDEYKQEITYKNRHSRRSSIEPLNSADKVNSRLQVPSYNMKRQRHEAKRSRGCVVSRRDRHGLFNILAATGVMRWLVHVCQTMHLEELPPVKIDEMMLA